jgi:hypothetical protein
MLSGRPSAGNRARRGKFGCDHTMQSSLFVMPALVAGIHVFLLLLALKTWKAGTKGR